MPEYKTIWPLKPCAAVILYAVCYFGDADDTACLQFGGINSKLATGLTINVRGGVDQKRVTVSGQKLPSKLGSRWCDMAKRTARTARERPGASPKPRQRPVMIHSSLYLAAPVY